MILYDHLAISQSTLSTSDISDGWGLLYCPTSLKDVASREPPPGFFTRKHVFQYSIQIHHCLYLPTSTIIFGLNTSSKCLLRLMNLPLEDILLGPHIWQRSTEVGQVVGEAFQQHHVCTPNYRYDISYLAEVPPCFDQYRLISVSRNFLWWRPGFFWFYMQAFQAWLNCPCSIGFHIYRCWNLYISTR